MTEGIRALGPCSKPLFYAIFFISPRIFAVLWWMLVEIPFLNHHLRPRLCQPSKPRFSSLFQRAPLFRILIESTRGPRLNSTVSNLPWTATPQSLEPDRYPFSLEAWTHTAFLGFLLDIC